MTKLQDPSPIVENKKRPKKWSADKVWGERKLAGMAEEIAEEVTRGTTTLTKFGKLEFYLSFQNPIKGSFD